MMLPPLGGTRGDRRGAVAVWHSKDDSTLPQIKVTMGSSDPLGMPLATDAPSGERADDSL